MAKHVGSLNAYLSLDSNRFNKGIKDAKRSAEQFGKQIKSIGSAIKNSIALPLLSLAGVGSFSYLIDSSAKAAIELGRTASAIGTTSEKLAAFQYYMKRAGFSVEETNRWLLYMNKNIGLAKLGTGEAALALQKLGLTAGHLAGLKADEQVLLLSKALTKVSSAAEKTAMITKIFGENSQMAAKEFELWANNSQKAEEFTLKLGTALNEIDVQKIRNAQASFADFQEVLKAIGMELAAYLSPYISQLSEEFINAANSGQGLRAKVQDFVEVTIRGGAKAAATILAIDIAFKGIKVTAESSGYLMLRSIELITKGFSSFYGFLEDTFQLIGGIIAKSASWLTLKFDEALLKVSDNLESFISKVNKIPGIKFKFAENFKEKMMQNVSVSEKAYNEANNKLTEAVTRSEQKAADGYVNRSNVLIQTIQQYREQMGEALGNDVNTINSNIESIKNLDANTESFLKTLNDVQHKWTEIAKTQGQANKVNKKTRDLDADSWARQFRMMDNAKKVLDEWIKKQQKLKQTAKEWVSDLTSEFVSLMKQGELTFKNIGKSVLELIRNKIFEKAITGLLNAGGKALGIPGFASGGFPEVNKPALVGEEGPEIILPTTAMQVIPLKGQSQKKNSASGITVNQSLHFDAGVNEAAKAVIYSMMPTIMNNTTRAVVEAQKRGRT